MRLRHLIRAAAVGGALMAGGPARADECSDSADAYQTATEDIVRGLRRYGACVRDSQGSDDCRSAFERLQRAQDDFAGAVSDYRENCRP